MANAEIYPIGGAWPLGQMTVASPGSPVPVYTPPAGGSTAGCRMLVIQALASNGGPIYVMYGNAPYTDAHHILAIVAAGKTVSLPAVDMLTESRIDLSRIYLDASAAGAVAVATAYDSARRWAPPVASVSSGAVSAWPMDEGSGLTFRDVSGKGNTATISGASAVTWRGNPGLPGVTPLWTGSGDAVAASASLTDFDGTTPFSVGFWIETSIATEAAFVGSLDALAATYQGWEVQVNGFSNPGGVNFLLINVYPSNSLIVQQAGNNVADGALHYVVVAYDGSRTPAGVSIYIDGTPASTFTSADSLSASAASGLPVRFGARDDGSDEYAGAMAFLEIWPYAVSAAAVAANYAKGPGIY